jgi:hypothetical protein
VHVDALRELVEEIVALVFEVGRVVAFRLGDRDLLV